MILAFTTLLALLFVNLGGAEIYAHVLERSILGLSLIEWVNDGLMAIFFYGVGLELRLEFTRGELRDPRRARLPIVAALGGMVVPALVYAAVAWPDASGWPVPMATDIAFALGVLSILGSRVPEGFRTLLMTLATVDDLGAIAVIALFFTKRIDLTGFAVAAAALALIDLSRQRRLAWWPLYVGLGVITWVGVLRSGVHATCAGVLLGVLTPRPERLVRRLHPWVNRLVLPLFALANAGVVIHSGELTGRVGLGVTFGLLLGKPLGITLAAWLATAFGGARLPAGARWSQIVGLSCLGGIGFTMSLFMANLSLEGVDVEAAKAAILLGSAASALLGAGLIFRTSRSRAA